MHNERKQYITSFSGYTEVTYFCLNSGNLFQKTGCMKIALKLLKRNKQWKMENPYDTFQPPS